MRKKILCVMIALSMVLPITKAWSGEGIANVSEQTFTQKTLALYNSIDFSGYAKPDFSVFEKAYTGYLNIINSGELNTNKQVLTICDMSMSANTNRMWIIDLKENKLLLNTYVAHGQGSGEEFANRFSNKMNSHQTSLGFYITGETYIGEHGNSLYLHGMDKGFNNLAYQRNIVVHGARYVCDNFIKGNERLGRSWGCPAVSDKISNKVIDLIKDGTCLFVYYPDTKYLQASHWLNKTPDTYASNTMNALAKKGEMRIVYEYGPTAQKVFNIVKQIQLPLF